MKYAIELGFSTINNYAVISDYVPGQSMQHAGIKNGDSVLLRFEDVWISVISVSQVSHGVFQGKIDGFEPIGVSFKTLSLGDDISFNETHVFVCVRKP
ncbi:hypothetical protein [Aeromonas enteropelogenes]|uniref:hypothetical protein n=1 Tax=Aeromonas enteropelogenes TaxID=29489 RepID=UPI0012E02490|nr:hypothetical protein [Aeromonas enteropelogenes]UBH52015.1 hypothetical protein LA321_18640 [Aeromonas enteropelogenes]